LKKGSPKSLQVYLSYELREKRGSKLISKTESSESQENKKNQKKLVGKSKSLALYQALAKALPYLKDKTVKELLLHNDDKLWVSRKDTGFTEFITLSTEEFSVVVERLMAYENKEEFAKENSFDYVPFFRAKDILWSYEGDDELVVMDKNEKRLVTVAPEEYDALIDTITGFQKRAEFEGHKYVEGVLPSYKELEGYRFTLMFSSSPQSPSVMIYRACMKV